ncbi:hypothetical protein Ssi03_57900 [Sphaerisporangium siamense]|uniref:Uncharacterized protein n=1 Tax=Sphaerisporangium siamense TaxID=795645 RepID=A0A7W7D4Z0_9ACTN|nr:DUF5825 family protein [Sphaerisporangium siamense]MBB4700382.1 hypothetical protein [Sphaerisporangium siamense]GII87800.1 hypothetical protein Ssi03_57900 [Sphaerisporangium siamense]
MSALMGIDELRDRGSDERRVPAGRPATLTLTLGSDWAELPAATELAALLRRVPVAGVWLAEAVDFSALPSHVIVRIVALLRECSSIGARVTWSLILGAEQLGLVPRLDHLPAPDSVTVVGEGTPSVGEWRSAGNFGLFYFRKGPNFLFVVDQRPESSREIVMDDPILRDVFLEAVEGCAWSEVARSSRYAAAARDLVDKGLVMRVGDHCVALPVRMRSWPLGVALLGGTLASAGKKSEDVTS